MNKIILINFRNLLKWLQKPSSFANHNWYIVLSLILSIVGVVISAWTLLVPVSNIQTEIQNLQYDFQKVYNVQDVNTSKLNGGDLIKKYYEYLNSNDFQKACSLLSIRMCSLYDVAEFTKWVEDKNRYLTVKLRDGEKLEKVWFSGQRLENTNSEIWCAKTSFQMNYEKENVEQVWQYTIAVRPDGNKEIRRSLCEFAAKNGENRSSQMACDSQPKFCNEK